jgi:hypothetical protein
MTARTLKRGGLRLALIVATCLALGACPAVGSATASTLHWTSASPAAEIPAESTQPFTAKLDTSVAIEARWVGVRISISCASLSSSGNVYNPATETAAGRLGRSSFNLSGCTVGGPPNCAIKGGSIPFRSLTGYARTEEGKRRLVLKPAIESTMAILEFQGSGGECGLPSLRVEGYIEAFQNAENAGHYEIYGPSHLVIGSSELKMSAGFSLNTSSGQLLALSSEGSAEPRWYYGVGEWSSIKAGESTSFWHTELVPLTLNTRVSGVKVEISGCEGYFGGHVENPIGGGAGIATAGYTPGFGLCAINVPHCSVYTPRDDLSGVATVIGGLPAVEWSPISGSTTMSFTLENSGGTCSLAPSSPLKATGKLITTSLGNGRFSFAGSELMVGSQAAPVSGEFGLETTFGKSLRLQP